MRVQRSSRSGRAERSSRSRSSGGGPVSDALATAVLALSPDAYFKLDDAAAPFVNSGALSDTATVPAAHTNGVTAQGIAGPDGADYVEFAASASALSFPDANEYSPLANAAGISVSLLYRPADVSGFKYLAAKAANTTADREWSVARNDDKITVSRFRSTGVTYAGRTSGAGLAAGQWAFITILFAQFGFPSIYINGVQSHATIVGISGSPSSAGPAPVNIGAFRDDFAGDPGGDIAHVAIFPGQLTGTQITDLATAAETDGWITL